MKCIRDNGGARSIIFTTDDKILFREIDSVSISISWNFDLDEQVAVSLKHSILNILSIHV